MLDDDFMWPLVRQARMGIADPQLVKLGWAEYRGDVLLPDIQREYGLEAAEAEKELGAWVARHGGQLRLETHPAHRAVGSKLPTAGSGGTSLLVLLPDAAVPAE